jgi:hypothetical protein
MSKSTSKSSLVSSRSNAGSYIEQGWLETDVPQDALQATSQPTTIRGGR